MSAITAYVAESIVSDPVTRRFGITIDSAVDGSAQARLTVAADMTNGLGVTQGGIVFALADTAFACAANSVNPGSATAAAGIEYLAPSRLGEELVARADVVVADGRRATVDVEIRVGERIVALFRGTARVLKPTRG